MQCLRAKIVNEVFYYTGTQKREFKRLGCVEFIESNELFAHIFKACKGGLGMRHQKVLNFFKVLTLSGTMASNARNFDKQFPRLI